MPAIELRRGDVVLVEFPFARKEGGQGKRRPALVIQADRYNRRREAVILAAITSTQRHRNLPCKVVIAKDGAEGKHAGLRTDSVVDCQTLVTVLKSEIAVRIGKFPEATMRKIDMAIADAIGLAGT